MSVCLAVSLFHSSISHSIYSFIHIARIESLFCFVFGAQLFNTKKKKKKKKKLLTIELKTPVASLETL